ncbi:WD40/YVTN/BNR-like repeat-containing protein [Thalassotalea fusca]
MKFLVGLILLSLNVTALADDMMQPAIESQSATKSLLLDITNVNNEFMIAVGERGHIVRATTLDSWQQMSVPTRHTLTAVTFSDSRHGWAVGHGALILHTNDGGFSWQVQQYLPETQKPLLDISFRNNMEGIAVGAYGMFFRTNDGGKTWQQEFHVSLLPQEDFDYLQELKKEDEAAYLDERSSILPHFNRFYIDGRTSYLAGEFGLLAKSQDFGKTWQRLDDIYKGSFYDISRTQAGNLLAVGLRGNVFRSLTNGTPWQHIATNHTALLNDVLLAGEQHILLFGNNGVMLKSSDDGQSFSALVQDDGKALMAACLFRDTIVVASEAGIKVMQVKL